MTGQGEPRSLLPFVAVASMLVGLVFGLTAYPLLDPDEGRNAEVAREMAASNDYVLPRLDGLPYVDKPVLFFAVEALAMEALGPTVLAARIPPLLFTLATIALIAWFARRRGGSEAAWTAAVATGAMPLTLGFGRTVIMDSALTFFVVLALVGFYEAVERRFDGSTVRTHEPPNPRAEPEAAWSWSALAWAAIAGAVLTKGPIGLALPLMVAIPYAAWRRASRVIWEPVGPLLFLALLLPWVIAMSRRVPGFLEYAVMTETLHRVATPALGRTGPVWYFVPIIVAGALPWSAAVLGGAVRSWGVWHRPDRTRESYPLFLALWVTVPLCFFSLSMSKRPQYVLPLMPAIALLAAHAWSTRAAAVALGLGGGLLLGAPWLVPRLLPLSPPIHAALPATAVPLGGIALLMGLVLWLARGRRDLALVAMTIPVAAIPVTGIPLMRAIGRERSAAELAAAITAVLPPGSDVAAIGAFPPSLPFYLRQPVLLATRTGSELTSNYLSANVQRWRAEPGSPLRPADWWLDAVATCGRTKMFVTRAADGRARAVLAGRLPLLAETPAYAAYGPCARSDLALGR